VIYISQNKEEVTIPKDLKEFLTDIVEKKHGYDIGEPWKYSEDALLVVVPITRKKAPRRAYTTMYEVLKDIDMKDTGRIDKVELQNKTGKAIFVRAGTIFAGKTQNRAAQHSGIYKDNIKVDIDVRCVQQTHGIRSGADMEYGSIAPMSVTSNLMFRTQGEVWESVRNFTAGETSLDAANLYNGVSDYRTYNANRRIMSPDVYYSSTATTDNISYTTSTGFTGFSGYSGCSGWNGTISSGSDDLLGYLKNKNKEALDEMMQKVPLFDNQAGAIIFDPLGVIAVEVFDSPKSWEAIKAEIIEKYGDHVSDEEAEHLFELNPDKILPMFKKFIAGLDTFEEKTIYKDELSETRSVKGKKVVGEYTLIRGRTIHCLLIKE
jgi:hypothetical protein